MNWAKHTPFKLPTFAPYWWPRTLLTLLLLALVPACGEKQADSLRVALTLWPPNEMAYLADEKGWFGGEDVRPIVYGSPVEYFPGYVTGNYDAAVVSLGSALEMVHFDPDHKIVMLIDYSRGGDALVAQSYIKTAADLKGKRIGYEATPLGAYMLDRFLAVSGIGLNEVFIEPIDVVLQERVFQDRRIDAVVTFEPVLSQLVGLGGKIIVDSSAVPEEIMDVLIVREPVLREKRASLIAFAEGWFKALDYHDKNTESAAELSAARQHVARASYIDAFEKVVMFGRETNRSLLVENPSSLIANLEKHRLFLEEAGTIEPGIDINAIIDPTLINEIP